MRSLYLLILLFVTFLLNAQSRGIGYYNLAEEKAVHGKLKKAYKYYYKAAELDNNYIYYVKAAEAYWLSHNMDKKENKSQVERLYNKSMNLKNWNVEGLISRASYWEYLANYKLALQDLDSLLVRDTANLDGYLKKANIYLSKKDTATGFRIYALAIKNTSNSNRANIYTQKGSYCYIKGYWQESVNSYLQALELTDKVMFKHYCFLSSSYYNLGKTDKACYYFELCDISKWTSLKLKDEMKLNCR
jgi:tetratricopeptide (TPR) repeat protein